MQKAVFLDRDGTIIEDCGYPHERSQISFLPGASEAIRQLNKNGFKVIVVTNQAGVARGYFTEGTVREINKYLQEALAEKGALIDGFYYCPHHPEGVIEPYRQVCHCRKPNPGMIEEAVRDFGIDVKKSFIIGDHLSDVEAGQRAGCRTILLARPDSPAGSSATAVTPGYIAPNLGEAVAWLLKLGTQGEKRL